MSLPRWPRKFSLALALLALAAAGNLPLHAHADHTAQVAHVEDAHGGHDAVLMQDGDRQRTEPPAWALAAAGLSIVAEEPDSPVRGHQAEQSTPSLRPPIAQPPPRAPPSLQ
ncbi:MAG: hypothetical protein HY700_15005 [Gemmatimonadetes bacterium]|nr:hypothetical protein [Gemmatimonadota bacterium]